MRIKNIDYDGLARIKISEASRPNLDTGVKISKYMGAIQYARKAGSAGLVERALQRLVGIGNDSNVEPNLRYGALDAVIRLADRGLPVREEAMKSFIAMAKQSPPQLPGRSWKIRLSHYRDLRF